MNKRRKSKDHAYVIYKPASPPFYCGPPHVVKPRWSYNPLDSTIFLGRAEAVEAKRALLRKFGVRVVLRSL